MVDSCADVSETYLWLVHKYIDSMALKVLFPSWAKHLALIETEVLGGYDCVPYPRRQITDLEGFLPKAAPPVPEQLEFDFAKVKPCSDRCQGWVCRVPGCHWAAKALARERGLLLRLLARRGSRRR